MLTIHVSKGNSKLGKIPSISFPPVLTCPAGVPCAKSCYAMKAWRMYPSVRNALTENWELWKSDPVEFERQLVEWLEKNRPAYFRYNVSGDIPSIEFVSMMARVANKFWGTKFLAYTKTNYYRMWIIDHAHTPNLVVRQSAWFGWPIITLDGLQAHIRDKDGSSTLQQGETPDIVCGGNCAVCKACWHGNVKLVLFDIH